MDKKILAASYSPRENPSTIGAKELNFCVRNGNRCDLLAIATRNLLTYSYPQQISDNRINITFIQSLKHDYRSSPRLISTGPLKTLLLLHSQPINQIVFLESYYLNGMGNLILRLASHLDAFSAYPNRT